MTELDEAVGAFSEWAQQQGLGPARAEVRIERLGIPHTASMLPAGWQGVYTFRYADAWLKVGKAGPKSGARWLSQHYNPRSAVSNLAFSLIKYAHFSDQEHPHLPGLRAELRGIAPDDIGGWIKAHTERVNLLIRAEMGKAGLDRLEAFAQLKLKPVFEGRWRFGGGR